MSLHTVVAWLPFRTEYLLTEDERAVAMDEGRDRVLSDFPVSIPLVDATVSETRCEWAQPPSDVSDELAQRSFLASTRFFAPVAVQATVAVDVDRLCALNDVDRLEESFVLHCAGSQLGSAIEQLLALSDLAAPSCVQTLKGVATVDGKVVCGIQEKAFRPQIGFPNPKDDPCWPPVQNLPLSDVVRWASRTRMFERSLADSRMARTLAAFTHVVRLANETDGEVLFRAMQGLEAFYCDGAGDLRRQLSEKVAIWLGHWADKRNLIGQLYDIRSKFIHGADLMEFSTARYAEWEDEKAMTQFSTATDFAVRLLVATLQKCAADHLVDVRWSYNVDVSPRPKPPMQAVEE